MVVNPEKDPQVIRVLVMSDEVDQRIYSSYLKDNFKEIELVISCGDLPFFYLEYIVDVLNVPMFFVHGNHDPEVEVGQAGLRRHPWGADNLDNKVAYHKGLLLAGFEGSIRYSKKRHEYTQREMWLKVMRLVPRLWVNKLRYGRYLDILVTHAPAWEVFDRPDPVHRGFKAFRWLLQTFKPRYHVHGHIHQLDRNQFCALEFEGIKIINAHTFKRLDIPVENRQA